MAELTERLEDARRLDIRDEARRLGLALANNGKAWFRPGGRGPGKGTPSGSFYRSEGAWKWYEHAEGVGGDVVDLVQYVHGGTVGEALDTLLGANRPPIPVVEYAAAEEREEVPLLERQRACEAFYAELPPLGDGAREWLESTRAISSATVSEFGLRQADETTADAAMGAAIAAAGVGVAQALGLAVPSKHSDSLRCPFGWGCWIAIPYRNGDRIEHIQFRRYSRSGNSKGPKYRHIRGEVPIPFNVAAFDHEFPPMLVEGAFDAMTLHQRGFPAIGIPGTSWLRGDGKAEAVVKGSDVLTVAFDADDAGRKAAEEVKTLLRAHSASHVAEVVWPPGFEGDWCDYYASGHPAAFEVRDAPVPRTLGQSTPGDLLDLAIPRLLGESRGERMHSGLSLGVDALDKWIALAPGSYNVIAGRPSDGKSQMLLSVAVNVAKDGCRVGFLSLEMSQGQLADRVAKSLLRIGRDVPRDLGRRVEAARAEVLDFRRLDIVFDHPEDRSVAGVVARLNGLAEDGCDLVCVDYIQHIATKENGIEQKTAVASKLLKAWAQKTNVPVLAAAALRRPENDREARKRPRIDQIRGSDQIAFDADVVLLMHYLHKLDPEEAHVGVRELYLDKNRNGLITTDPIQVEHPEPFGFFGELSYRTQMGMHAGAK